MEDPTKPATVLVADDSRFFRALLSQALDEEGLRCLTAASGDEAIERLARELPDVQLVLLDLMMPGKNGFAVLESIRADARTAGLPVVVLSQYQLNEVERGILQQQRVAAVVPKTAPLDRVLYEIRRAIHPGERERRHSDRVPVSLGITVRSPRETYLSTTFNLSPRGVFVAISDREPPKTGTEVKVRFWVPGEEALFELPAVVAWTNTGGEGFRRSHPAGFGLEFKQTSGAAIDAINRYLRSVV